MTCRKIFRKPKSATKYMQENLKSITDRHAPIFTTVWGHKHLLRFSNPFSICQKKIIFLFIFFQQCIAIQISPDQVISFGGSTDPCAVCFLYSIGKIGEQENKVYSRLLCDLLNKQLKIPSDR